MRRAFAVVLVPLFALAAARGQSPCVDASCFGPPTQDPIVVSGGWTLAAGRSSISGLATVGIVRPVDGASVRRRDSKTSKRKRTPPNPRRVDRLDSPQRRKSAVLSRR